MPVYTFKCSVCGHVHDEVRTIANRSLPSPCPQQQCDGAMERAMFLERTATPPEMEYSRPFLSEALGVDPSQINDAKRRFPDHKFHPDGRMIIESHKERKQVIKDLGFRDNDSYS